MNEMLPEDENDLIALIETDVVGNETQYVTEDIGGGVYTVYVRNDDGGQGRYVGNLHFSKTPDGTDRGKDTAALRHHGVHIQGAQGIQVGSHGNTQYNTW